MRQRGKTFTYAAAAALLASACATGYHDRDYDYDGREWSGERRPYQGDLTGPGVTLLDPWLLETEEGRAVVTLGFQESADGYISEGIAHRANIWFRRYADHDRDMRITDPEIRTALVAAAGRHLRR